MRTAQAAQRKRGYCAACRAQQCPTCGRYAGQHDVRCRRGTPQQGRPRLTTVYGVVGEAELVQLFQA
jgi:hypothetical protein